MSSDLVLLAIAKNRQYLTWFRASVRQNSKLVQTSSVEVDFSDCEAVRSRYFSEAEYFLYFHIEVTKLCQRVPVLSSPFTVGH